MYDVYQHKTQTIRRLMVQQGAHIPRAEQWDEWELIGWTADISDAAAAAVEQDGFYLYEYSVPKPSS